MFFFEKNSKIIMKNAKNTIKKANTKKKHLKKKALAVFSVSAFSASWTSQGLNLGPPDYESVALTN